MRLPVAAAVLAFALHAQTLGTVESRYAQFQVYLQRRAEQVTERFPGSIKTIADWKARRPELLQQVRYMLGLDPPPPKTPLNPRITSSFERDSYRVEMIVFESMPGLYVTGNLYLPKARQGRLPTVLYLCGHSPGPWGNKVDYQHHGIWLARHGYVTFVIDSIEFGEIPGIHHGTHDLEMWDWLSLGYSPAGAETWNAIRAVDYLLTRPEVDPGKLAVTGISGGGAITWYTAAVDERLAVAAPVCSTWTAGHHTALNAVHENCDCIYHVNTFLADLPAVAGLIAPRPLKIISAIRDPSFPAAGYHDVYRRARTIYELAGASDRIAEYDHDAPHADILPFRKQADEWLNRWLVNDLTPFEEGEIQKEQPEKLRVLSGIPADAVNGHIHKTFIPAASLHLPKDLADWNRRRTELLAELKDKSFRAMPQAKIAFDARRREVKDWSDRYARAWDLEFNTEQDIRVAARLYIPRSAKPTRPALIYVKGKKDIIYPVDYDPLLGILGTHVVLVLHPRAVEYPMDNYKEATVKRTAALFGATLESMQVWDILRAIDYLREAEGLALSSVSVYARKEMAVPAMYAAALDERITRVILDDPPYSHWQGPAILNALRFTDLPEVAALLAPRELVSLMPLPDPYRFTLSVYGLYGKKDRIREARSLDGAVEVWKQE